MYQGRYSVSVNTAPVRKGTAKRRRLRWSKSFAVLACVAVLLTGFVGSSLAWLMDDTDPVVNEFTPGKVSTSINENMNGNTKSNVSFTNTGNVPAYIRAKLVITWQDGSGNVYGQAPVLGVDYTMSGPGSGWQQSGDYYYYTAVVQPNDVTGVLFASITQTGDNPAAGYTLHVEVLAEAIQAEPLSAVSEAWGWSPSNTND